MNKVKSGKLLAWQIKQLESKTPIISMINNGQVVIDPVEMNSAFRVIAKNCMMQKKGNWLNQTEWVFRWIIYTMHSK